ncbi:sodium:solute symporter [candidate division KSB1 bacterium]|nr:sodium:solute symporter [candidate division KSB1 bacterium]
MNVFVTFDWIVVAGYFLVIMGIAVWAMRQKQESSEDYFLAGRHVGWFVIGASIFASNIGAEHVVGLAGTATKTGVVMGHYELHSWLVLLLGWVFVPFYMRSRVFTMPEFLEKRYGGEARWMLTLVSLVAYVITKVAVNVYAGAVVFKSLMGIDFWTGAVIVIVLTGLYTVIGGLRTVVYTEALQAIVLILGALVVTLTGLYQLGGWNGLVDAVGTDHLNLFLPLDHPDFPWLGMLLAPPIVGLWYWCTDQYIVQRVLSARDETQARRGSIFASYLKLLPFFIFILPGVIAYGLTQKGLLQFGAADEAFPTMVKTLLPIGVRGLVAGGLLAALMSSLAAVFNSCSTLFTMDIYKKIRPEAPEKTLVRVGRIATGVVVISGLLWIPLMKYISSELYHYLQSVQAYLAPPIAAVFFFGLFFSRLNAKGATTAMVSGFLVGMARLVAELSKSHLSGWLYRFASVNFLYFAVYLFFFCVAVLVLVSLLTAPPTRAKLQGLTYATTVQADRESSRASWTMRDLVLSVVVVFLIVAIMICFSPLGIAG